MTPFACNACGGALKRRFATVLDPQTHESFAIDACEECGLGHTTPQPENLLLYYASTYHGGRHGLTAAYCARRRRRIVTRVAGAGQDRRLLDVGCGDGTFLLAAEDAGWDVMGTEINPTIARASGLDVRESLEQVQLSAPFDCITLWHSLEHLRDPRGTVSQLASMLKPGGLLIAAVPDAEGIQASAFGSVWFHLDVPRHLYHFGDRSLTRMLNVAGFDILSRWHQELEYDLVGWAQSALNRMLPMPNVFFNLLTGRAVRATKSSLAVSGVLGALLMALALPATALGTFLRRGGTLIVVARR